MIELMDLRTGNYIHPPASEKAGPDTSRYVRVISIDLLQKKVHVKADNSTEIVAYAASQIYGCSIDQIRRIMGGFSFNEHSIIIEGEGAVFIVHENGSSVALPHVVYLHQFQNLFRSLTAQEFPFNIP